VLNPLLALSLYHPEVIYAWELINEPELVTKGWWLPRYKEPPTIEEEAMRSFLAEGLGRIWSARFKATIGFNRLETILNTEIITDLNQFHHYPEHRFFDRELPKRLGPQFFGSELPLIVGEFATSLTEHTWPELPTQRVLEKLRRAESLGYPMAMPWSFINQDPKKDLNSVWTPQVESDIGCFTQGRNC
jgi:hypothetical protein